MGACGCHILVAYVMDFLGRCKYDFSFEMFFRFIEYYRFIFGDIPEPTLFFPTSLPFVIFSKMEKVFSLEGRGGH
jgi:hypothetical protein